MRGIFNLDTFVNCLHSKISPSPILKLFPGLSSWKVEQVQSWIKSLVLEFHLDPNEVARLSSLDGKQLGSLNRDDVIRITSLRAGHVIFGRLEMLKNSRSAGFKYCIIIFILSPDGRTVDLFGIKLSANVDRKNCS